MVSASVFHHDYPYKGFAYVEPISKDWTVTVNGAAVPVYTCRISKYPFNRVWTDQQRPVNQSEICSFVNLVSDEPVEICAKTGLPHSRVLVKPISRGIQPAETDGEIRFSLAAHGTYVVEADSCHGCLFIFNNAPIPAPEKNDVTWYFGPGVHMPGKITLHSHESVYVDRDALVFGCILAENAEDIHIFGSGILDDSNEERFANPCYEPYANGNLKFYDCKNIRIEGIGVRNSANWCLSLFHCEDVTVDGLRIFGQWRYNTDGIDIINSRNVLVQNAFVHSFDDSVTIKGIDRYSQTDNEYITIRDSILWCDWGKTCEIGLETACRRYRDIAFENCDLLRCGNTALDIQNGDYAEVSNIRFENIRAEFNGFDTPPQLQETDESVYTLAGETTVPNVVNFINYPWRNPETERLWHIPLINDPMPPIDDIRPGSVHDITVKNISVWYDELLKRKTGQCRVPFACQSIREGVRFWNISVSHVTVNGVPVTAENADITLEQTDNFILS